MYKSTCAGKAPQGTRIKTVVAADNRCAEILVFAEVSEERAGIYRLMVFGHENELEQFRLIDREPHHAYSGFLESRSEVDDFADIAVELFSGSLTNLADNLVHAVENSEDRTR